MPNVLIVGNEKDILQHMSAMALEAAELETCKWFRAISFNKWICNCIYLKCAWGCFPSESTQCEILSDAHKNTPRAVQNKNPADTYCIAKIWNIHDAQCLRHQCRHGGRTGGDWRDKLAQLAACSRVMRRKCWYKWSERLVWLRGDCKSQMILISWQNVWCQCPFLIQELNQGQILYVWLSILHLRLHPEGILGA